MAVRGIQGHSTAAVSTVADPQTGDERLPSDWPLVPLGALCSFSNGVNAEKSAYGKGVPFINVLDVITHTHIHKRDIPGRIQLSESAIDAFRVRRGDVVFNRTSETSEEVGLSAVYDDDAIAVFGGFVIRGRFLDESLDSAYVEYAFRAASVRSQIIAQGQGAIRSNVGQSSLKRVLVPVPSKPEQLAIAEALADVDGLISVLDRLIAKKRAIKQGAMQRLLTGRTRLPGFATEWSEMALGDLLRVRHGRSQRGIEEPHGRYPILASGGILGRTNVAIHEGPSVLIGRKGTIDRPQYSEGPFWTIDTLFFTDIHDSGDPKFLFYLFALIDWRSMNEASGVPSLSARSIESIQVRVPEKLEQVSIAAVLSDMDAEIAALKSRRDKSALIKQGMMQELLTGRTRLVESRAPAA